MQITWKVTKPRGHCPPVLAYKCTPDALDLDLCVHVKSTITINGYLPSGSEAHSRAAVTLSLREPAAIILTLPELAGQRYYHTDTIQVYLPWREDGDYSYVDGIMHDLMAEWEVALLLAARSLPVDIGGTVEYSEATQIVIVPIVAARKMGVEPTKY